MGWRRVVGKLLLVGAGCGVLVLLVFMGPSLLEQMLGPEEPLAPEEIVAEAMQAAEQVEERTRGVEATGDAEDHAAAHSPSLVAVRDNGEEIAVVFPAAGAEETPQGIPEVRDGAAEEEREAASGGPAGSLPPVLSPEEVAAAMDALEAGAGEAGELVADARSMPEPMGEAKTEGTLAGAELPVTMQPEGWQPEVILVTDLEDGGHVEVTLPPPSATRDVQELLEALGYAPGPLDGIWGERTEGAWRSFARDAAELAAREEPARLGPEPVAEASVPEIPTPTGEFGQAEVVGGRQAGGTRPPAGLPLQGAERPVTVPGTLRGVMGYRMPLVSRQEVPDQVVSGVLIPAHTTFVILKPGHWELVGLEPGEVERLRGAAAQAESSGNVKEVKAQPVKRDWNLLGLFRKRGPSGGRK